MFHLQVFCVYVLPDPDVVRDNERADLLSRITPLVESITVERGGIVKTTYHLIVEETKTDKMLSKYLEISEVPLRISCEDTDWIIQPACTRDYQHSYIATFAVADSFVHNSTISFLNNCNSHIGLERAII